MRKTTVLMAAVIVCAACSAVFALYSVRDEGLWPKSWPQELEPLRKQARTFQGPHEQLHYLIPFTKRDDFESAWPHLLKVKSKTAPLILVPGPKTDFMPIQPAGVIMHAPPARVDQQADPEPHFDLANLGSPASNITYIELIVDGEIVDLNRIPLPADTPIIDRRFKDAPKK